MYELHRTAHDVEHEAHRRLRETKLARLSRVDAELHELEYRLDDVRRQVLVREPGVGGECPHCGELFASSAHYCSNCGHPLTESARRELAKAQAPCRPSPRRAGRRGRAAGRPGRPADAGDRPAGPGSRRRGARLQVAEPRGERPGPPQAHARRGSGDAEWRRGGDGWGRDAVGDGEPAERGAGDEAATPVGETGADDSAVGDDGERRPARTPPARRRDAVTRRRTPRRRARRRPRRAKPRRAARGRRRRPAPSRGPTRHPSARPAPTRRRARARGRPAAPQADADDPRRARRLPRRRQPTRHAAAGHADAAAAGTPTRATDRPRTTTPPRRRRDAATGGRATATRRAAGRRDARRRRPAPTRPPPTRPAGPRRGLRPDPHRARNGDRARRLDPSPRGAAPVSTMETPPTDPTAIQPGPPERRCPRCGSTLAPDQEWCLSCGAAAGTEVVEASGWRVPLYLGGGLARWR